MDHALANHLIVQPKLFVQVIDQFYVMMELVNNLIHNVTNKLLVPLEKEGALMEAVNSLKILVVPQLHVQF